MRNVIIDSSSAILLYRCNMIPALLKYCNPVIPEAVFAELTVPYYIGADIFADLCNADAIKVYTPGKGCTEELNGSLHAGEREVIALFKEGEGDFIIIDDGPGGAYCRDKKIPYINALLAVKIMFIKHLITDTEYDHAWSWLISNARYSEKVINWAGNAGEDELCTFL